MRAKMSRANRAKQFMPFSALTGLEPAMREKEFVPLEQILLGEDAQRELDLALRSIPPGAEVCAVYYADGRYETCCGVFRGKDEEDGSFRIGRERIRPEALLTIESYN